MGEQPRRRIKSRHKKFLFVSTTFRTLIFRKIHTLLLGDGPLSSHSSSFTLFLVRLDPFIGKRRLTRSPKKGHSKTTSLHIGEVSTRLFSPSLPIPGSTRLALIARTPVLESISKKGKSDPEIPGSSRLRKFSSLFEF